MNSDFFAPEVEFSVGLRKLPVSPAQRWHWGRLGATAAAAAISGMLAFNPPPADLTKLDIRPAVVQGAYRAPAYVPIPELHRKAAERFAAQFEYVPPTDADRTISPDYGL